MMKLPHFFGEICEHKCADQRICHAVSSATRVNQGVGPCVLQHALASFCRETQNTTLNQAFGDFFHYFFLDKYVCLVAHIHS